MAVNLANGDGPTVLHSEGVIRNVSDDFCNLVGVSDSDELTAEPLDRFIAASDRDALADTFERIEAGGMETVGQQVTVTGRHGADCEVLAVTTSVLWEDCERLQTRFIELSSGQVQHFSSLKEDALHGAPVGITIADVTPEDDPLIYVNDGFLDLTGYNRAEILGQNCRILQGEATRTEPVDRMRGALAAGEQVTVELRNYRADGSMFWNRVTLSPIENDDGVVTHYLGFQEDITEAKANEEMQSLFQTYARQSEAALFITDPNGVIEYVNPAFEHITGFKKEEAIGATPRILKSDEHDDQFYADLWETITDGQTWESTITNRRKSGELYETTQVITPLQNDDDTIQYYVALERDITQRQLRRQLVDVLNRILRHNIRNAVTVIDMNAQSIESSTDEAGVSEAASTIRTHTSHLKRLADVTTTIRTLTDVLEGRAESTPMEITSVESLIREYEERHPEVELGFLNRVNAESPIKNGAVFEVVMTELLENAIEHNDRQVPSIDISISHAGDTDSGKAIITVADNGPEIPPETWDIITSGEETQLRHTQGIGLWVVYWAVTALGGRMELSSNDPRGNVITLQIPLVEPH